MPRKPQNDTPPTSSDTNEPRTQDALRAEMNEFFRKPMDPELAAVDKWCDFTLKLAAHDDRLETEEVAYIHAREKLDQREEHLVAAHEIGFKLLLEVVHALKGITEDDLGARLDKLLNQTNPATVHSIFGSQSKIKPFKDEATLIRREISVREGLKSRITELEHKNRALEFEKRDLSASNAKMKKENRSLKNQLKARSKASMVSYWKLKSLEGKYEWLTEYTNNLVGITREVVFAGPGLEDERKQIRMVRELPL